MAIWSYWLDAIRGLLDLLTSEAGLGLGLAIVTATILMKTVILPVSWTIGYRTSLRQRKMATLQPALQQLKEQYGAKPELYMQQLNKLYRKHGVSLMDGKSVLGSIIQMPVMLGMVQVLRNIGEGARFLWVPNLIKPDLALAVIAGLTTALVMMVNPDMPAHTRTLMIIVPSIIATVMALKFCSALAVYWTASNCYSAIQTAALHHVINRRIRAGVLKM